MSPARAPQDNQCYMKLINISGRDQLADCGRRFAEGQRVAAPFIVCQDCEAVFREVVKLAKDRGAVCQEWDDG